ncbi:MAG: hypothetical protein EP343_23190 [Deltaproteobacteria bacterium]|nr:MAG: hypothetical protein EP343_23190 [Deltaproteobacteria bacterium]
MPMKRENLTWLPFAFLGALNVVGFVVFFWAWVAMQVVSPESQAVRNAASHASQPCLLAIHWGLKKPLKNMQAQRAFKTSKPRTYRQSGQAPRQPQKRDNKLSVKKSKKRSFFMDLLSI